MFVSSGAHIRYSRVSLRSFIAAQLLTNNKHRERTSLHAAGPAASALLLAYLLYLWAAGKQFSLKFIIFTF
jgi:hypothetical protein